jgi:hypothetical protein
MTSFVIFLTLHKQLKDEQPLTACHLLGLSFNRNAGMGITSHNKLSSNEGNIIVAYRSIAK